MFIWFNKKRKHLNCLTHYNINKCVIEAMIYRALKETHNRQHINYRTNLRKGKKKKKECNELETKTQKCRCHACQRNRYVVIYCPCGWKGLHHRCSQRYNSNLLSRRNPIQLEISKN